MPAENARRLTRWRCSRGRPADLHQCAPVAGGGTSPPPARGNWWRSLSSCSSFAPLPVKPGQGPLKTLARRGADIWRTMSDDGPKCRCSKHSHKLSAIQSQLGEVPSASFSEAEGAWHSQRRLVQGETTEIHQGRFVYAQSYSQILCALVSPMPSELGSSGFNSSSPH